MYIITAEESVIDAKVDSPDDSEDADDKSDQMALESVDQESAPVVLLPHIPMSGNICTVDRFILFWMKSRIFSSSYFEWDVEQAIHHNNDKRNKHTHTFAMLPIIIFVLSLSFASLTPTQQ